VFSTICYHPRQIVNLFHSCDDQAFYKIFVNAHASIAVFGINLAVIITFFKSWKIKGNRRNCTYPAVLESIFGPIFEISSNNFEENIRVNNDGFLRILTKALHSWIFTFSVVIFFSFGIPAMHPDYKFTFKDFLYPCLYPVFVTNFFRLYYMQILWIICNFLGDECQINRFININNNQSSNLSQERIHGRPEDLRPENNELMTELEAVRSHYKSIWELTAKIDGYLTWFISILLLNLFTGLLHPIDQSIYLIKEEKISGYFVLIPWIFTLLLFFAYTFFKILNIPLSCEKFISFYTRKIGAINSQHLTDKFVQAVSCIRNFRK